MADNYTQERAFDWNDTIVKDDEYELFPEGIYDFRVEILERGRFEGSEKMSACPQANLTLAITDPVSGKRGQIKDTLFLHSKAEWKLSQFFTAIGQKKKGEPLAMNWNAVPGSTGRLELSINQYTDRNGNKAENNRVKKYLPKEQKVFTPGQF